MEVQRKSKLDCVPNPPEKEVSPFTSTPGAFFPGTVAKDPSDACGFPLGKVRPVTATTRLIPKRKELIKWGLKVRTSLTVNICRRESYPVRLSLSSSGCLTVPVSNM